MCVCVCAHACACVQLYNTVELDNVRTYQIHYSRTLRYGAIVSVAIAIDSETAACIFPKPVE